jgi:hypothetical protein
MYSYLSDTKIFKIFLIKEYSPYKCGVEKNPHYLKAVGVNHPYLLVIMKIPMLSKKQ